jgi:CRISPR-associated protein Csc2
VLRTYKAGGRFAQNRTAIVGGPGQSFDLNTVVFGDSAMDGTRVLPVKAAVNYSDALSVQPASLSQLTTMHHLSGEEGTLFDVETQKNSVNLFERHVIRPGTLMVQVLTTRGKTLTVEAFNHLLLSLGLGGAYGGQTSVTGTNIRTHLVGVYGGPFEQPESSPYVLLKSLGESSGDLDLEAVCAQIHTTLSAVYPAAATGADISAYRDALIKRFMDADPALDAEYKATAAKYATFFDRYFGTGAPKKPRNSGKNEAAKASDGPAEGENT